MSKLLLCLFANLLLVAIAVGQQPNTVIAKKAIVPRLIRFGGVLKDAEGKPLAGTVGITFALYKEQEGGPALWLETQNVPVEANGHYSVLLGASKEGGVPMELFTSGDARWLGVQVESQKEQTRILLLSVPYALKAADAETVGGKPASAFMLAPNAETSSVSSTRKTANTKTASETVAGAPTGSGTVGRIARWTGTSTLGNSALFQSTANNIGIGTTTPTVKFEVKMPSPGIHAPIARFWSAGVSDPNSIQVISGPNKAEFFVAGNANDFMFNTVQGDAGINANPGQRIVFGGNGSSRVARMIIAPNGDLTVGGDNGGVRVNSVTNSSGWKSINVIAGFNGNFVGPGVIGATIAGGGMFTNASLANSVTGLLGTVSGGEANTAGNSATVGGGGGNTASGADSTVGGGGNNNATNDNSTVGGGRMNTAGGIESTVGGGEQNSASGSWSTVAGGDANIAGGSNSAVGGGFNNHANGDNSVIPGGENNTASAPNSFAAGQNAHALHPGAFVWGDANVLPVSSTAPNQFVVRATGGVGFISSINSGGHGMASISLAPGAGAWSSLSDRDSKDDFAPVDSQALLSNLAAIPVMTWHYKAQSPSIRHIGPVAQDFRAVFGLGEDDKHISTVDADGVAFAAIQALYRLNVPKDKKIAQLELRLAKLEHMMAEMKPTPPVARTTN